MTSKRFAKRILEWFDQHGRKDLPWQQEKSAYRVWISEIMLQQTQVKTVIPYYLRFMARFPTLQLLAQAESDEVLHYWSGLGYYSRARNLHLAAQEIIRDHAGVFPNNLTELQALPGIGRSTAGAILAIAFQSPTPILDGNVKRVLARFHGIREVVSNKIVENQLWNYAESYVPSDRVADYTQAMMDLGATLCTRSRPHCQSCPLMKECIAYRDQLTPLIPAKKTAPALPVRTSTFLIIHTEHEVLLKKRGPRGIWGGLWAFPELSDATDIKTIRAYYFTLFQQMPDEIHAQGSFRHTFSHYHLDIHPVFIPIRQRPRKVMEQNNQIWYNLNQPAAIGLPKPIAHLLQEIPSGRPSHSLYQAK